MTWRGAQCYCPLGQKPAGTSCVDTNECENNVCDQICQVICVCKIYLCGFVKMYLSFVMVYQ